MALRAREFFLVEESLFHNLDCIIHTYLFSKYEQKIIINLISKNTINMIWTMILYFVFEVYTCDSIISMHIAYLSIRENSQSQI